MRSPRALADDIEHWLADEPVSAWREPWPARRAAVAGAAPDGDDGRRRGDPRGGGRAGRRLGRAGGGEPPPPGVARPARRRRRRRDSRQPRAPRGQCPRAAGPRRAQRRFALARKAVESYYTGASEDVLLKQPHLASLRNKLLNMSLAFYEELHGELEREGRHDPATRAELAAAYERVGEITEQVGTRASALEALHRARAIRESLMTADPSAAGPRRDLAGVLETIGILQSRTSGREAEALPTLERALRTARGGRRRPPRLGRRPCCRRGHSPAHGQQPLPPRTCGPGGAVPGAARAILERLEAEYPDRESIRSEAANVLKQLSYPERVSGRH